jgi:cellulose synthase/poly-beta-1,6-N-acetylglucosamine synthase-like glycosyltransferase
VTFAQVVLATNETAAVAPVLEIVVPVYNEHDELVRNVNRLRDWLDAYFPLPTLVTVVDNASTDGTWALAQQLQRRRAGVRAVRLEAKGRGRALRAAWSASAAQIVAYMDLDLSTGLDALLPLVAPLLSGPQSPPRPVCWPVMSGSSIAKEQ